MRYTLEYKLRCIELYKQGLWPETPYGFKNAENFHKEIRKWKRLYDFNGIDAIRPKTNKKQWSAKERFELVTNVIIAGKSAKQVACENGLEPSQLHKWVKQYMSFGYDGLENKPMGRPRKNTTMKKTPKNTKPLTEEEREELIRLRSEIEYLKTENEVIKKSIALRHAEWDEQLKAKRQKSSKNSEKKDSN